MERKNSFLLYLTQKETFEALEDVEAGELIKKIFEYCETEEMPQFSNRVISMAFTSIKSTLDDNKAKYEERCRKNKENISKRWGGEVK